MRTTAMAALWALVACCVFTGPAVFADDGDGPVLPGEVTIQDTPAGEVFADASGRTLYTYAADALASDKIPTCVGECAQTWPPLAAPPNAKVTGDWSPVKRADGALQWSFAGKPVYTFTADSAPGQAQGAGVTGWTLAKYVAPPPVLVTPGVVGMQKVGKSYVLTDAVGHTLYARSGPCSKACEQRWPPLIAAALANEVGDWTLVARDDGLRQWAFAKSPVHTFAADSQPGELNGENVDGGRSLRP